MLAAHSAWPQSAPSGVTSFPKLTRYRSAVRVRSCLPSKSLIVEGWVLRRVRPPSRAELGRNGRGERKAPRAPSGGRGALRAGGEAARWSVFARLQLAADGFALREQEQVIRAAGLGVGAAHIEAAEGMGADHGAGALAVQI